VVSQNAEATRDAIGRVENKLDALIATMQDLTAAIRGTAADDVPQPRDEAAG
jgi:seryl-tRNA synthetase